MRSLPATFFLFWILLSGTIAGAASSEHPPEAPASSDGDTEIDLDLLGSSAWGADAALAERVGENLRWALDGSARVGWSSGDADWIGVEALGLDLFTIISGRTRDLVRINLQLYGVRTDTGQSHPYAFNGDGKWKFQPRNSFVDLLILPRGQMTLRAGHFELPYGIETYVDTNGTLRQYTIGRELGEKTDWGVALTGSAAQFEWIASLSRGSGNEWNGSGDPWLALGRVATPVERAAGIGFTVAGGDVRVGGKGPPSSRWRAAVDGRVHFLGFDLLGEITGGFNEKNPQISGVVELDWTDATGDLLTYFQAFPQWRRQDGKSNMGAEFRAGLLWRLLTGLSLSAEVRQVAAPMGDGGHPTTLFTQVRYRR
ncbi:MAG: hypothetical protein VCC00_05365 [Deltaproteobacteria bacterium]